jgi:putative oxidoreductase
MPGLFPAAADLGLLALRAALGVLLAAHGHPKLFKDFKGTRKFVGSLGFRPAGFWAFMLGSAEFFGGLALVLGFSTRAAALMLTASMLVALYMNAIAWKKPFKGGWELDLLIIASLLLLLLAGAGAYSFDAALGWPLG